MIQGKKKKPQVFFDSDDEHDLDLFCRIEEALRIDTQPDDNYKFQQQEQSRLASEFPSCFVQSSDPNDPNCQSDLFNLDNEDSNNHNLDISKDEIIQFHEMYKQFQAKLTFLSEKQKEIDRDTSWIKKEKKELERERKRIEADRMIVESDLSNMELLDLRQKYEDLQKKYETEKNEWNEEKQSLLEQIDELKSQLQPDQMTKIQVKTPKNAKIKRNQSIKDSQNIDNDTNSNSSSSSSLQIKKSKQSKPKFSVFTNKPLHPSYNLELLFDPGPVLSEEVKSNDGRKLLRYKNNISATLFTNGTKKMRYKDTVFIIYSNGDTAQEFKDGARGYRYAETGAIELQLPDQTILYEFPEVPPSKSGVSQKVDIKQREIHHPNGEKEILFPNGAKKILHKNGDYEIYHLSGRVEKCINGNVINTYD